jgi:hypothetical protein
LLLLPLKSRKGRSGIPTLCANEVGVEIEDKNPIVIIQKVTINFVIILCFLLTNTK